MDNNMNDFFNDFDTNENNDKQNQVETQDNELENKENNKKIGKSKKTNKKQSKSKGKPIMVAFVMMIIAAICSGIYGGVSAANLEQRTIGHNSSMVVNLSDGETKILTVADKPAIIYSEEREFTINQSMVGPNEPRVFLPTGQMYDINLFAHSRSLNIVVRTLETMEEGMRYNLGYKYFRVSIPGPGEYTFKAEANGMLDETAKFKFYKYESGSLRSYDYITPVVDYVYHFNQTDDFILEVTSEYDGYGETSVLYKNTDNIGGGDGETSTVPLTNSFDDMYLAGYDEKEITFTAPFTGKYKFLSSDSDIGIMVFDESYSSIYSDINDKYDLVEGNKYILNLENGSSYNCTFDIKVINPIVGDVIQTTKPTAAQSGDSYFMFDNTVEDIVFSDFTYGNVYKVTKYNINDTSTPISFGNSYTFNNGEYIRVSGEANINMGYKKEVSKYMYGNSNEYIYFTAPSDGKYTISFDDVDMVISRLYDRTNSYDLYADYNNEYSLEAGSSYELKIRNSSYYSKNIVVIIEKK